METSELVSKWPGAAGASPDRFSRAALTGSISGPPVSCPAIATPQATDDSPMRPRPPGCIGYLRGLFEAQSLPLQ